MPTRSPGPRAWPHLGPEGSNRVGGEGQKQEGREHGEVQAAEVEVQPARFTAVSAGGGGEGQRLRLEKIYRGVSTIVSRDIIRSL